jgi:hypothetical protein
VALLERLQILIDADASGAVREFKKIGNTADRELGKATKSMDKMSAKLTSFGAGAVVGAAALGAGLAMFAKEAGEAEVQQLKLTNSIKNSDSAFAGNGKALRDQASALMQKTVADDDAIVSAQALLVQFGRTSSETEKLTPLVVDLARKLSIDLDSAAKAVGKASDGSAGALKKMGIEVVDLGGGATDTENVIAALAGSVKGFAESEGQTFAGQLQIMSNSFSELKENVGKGVLEIVNPILGIGAAAGSVNPAIAETAGKLGTIGAGAAGMIGTVSIATGALMKMKGQFTQVTGSGAAATTSLTTAGKAAGALGALAAAAVVYELGKALNDASINADKLAAATDRGSTAFAKTGKIDLGNFKASTDEMSKIGDDVWDGINRGLGIGASNELKSDGVVLQIDNVLRGLKDLQKAGKDEELAAYLLQFQNAEFEDTPRGRKRRTAFIGDLSDMRNRLTESTAAQDVANMSTEEAADAAEEATVSMKGYDRQLKFVADTQKLGADRAANFAKAIEDSSTLDDQATAAFGMNDAYKGLFNTLNDLPKEFDAVKSALGDYSDEQNKAVEAVINFGGAASSVLEQAIATGGDPAFLGGIFRSRLEETLKNANIPPEQIAEYVGLAGLSEEQINIAIAFSLSEEERQKFINIKDLFQAEIDESPIEFRAIINEAVDAGEFAKASVLVKAYTGLLTPIELGFVLAADPRLAASLPPALATAQAAVDVQPPVAVPFVPKTEEFNDAIDYLRFTAQIAANNNPITVPVVASVFGPGGLFSPGGLLNPGKKPAPAPATGVAGIPGLTEGDIDGNPYTPFAKGGSVMGGRTIQVNERGRELFTPNSNGFIMNAGDAQALLQGVSQLVSSGGGGMVNNFTVITPDAETAASATARKLRDAAWRN